MRKLKGMEAQGVTFPIHLDVPVDQTNKNAVSGMNSVKQTLETVLGSDNIVIDVQQLSTDDFGNVAFLAPNPAARDYDLNFDGWVGDYQDPSTYLDPSMLKQASISRFLVLMPRKTKSSLRVWGSIPIHNSWKKQMLRIKMSLSVMKNTLKLKLGWLTIL